MPAGYPLAPRIVPGALDDHLDDLAWEDDPDEVDHHAHLGHDDGS